MKDNSTSLPWSFGQLLNFLIHLFRWVVFELKQRFSRPLWVGEPMYTFITDFQCWKNVDVRWICSLRVKGGWIFWGSFPENRIGEIEVKIHTDFMEINCQKQTSLADVWVRDTFQPRQSLLSDFPLRSRDTPWCLADRHKEAISSSPLPSSPDIINRNVVSK